MGSKTPQGMANHRGSDRHGVPFADSVSLELPPPKTSTGLRTPEVPNPFFDQRDASNVNIANHYANLDSVVPMDRWIPHGMPFDAFDPDTDTRCWKLGDNDLLSMFNDYFYDEQDQYLANLQLVNTAYQGGAPGDFSFEPEELVPETHCLAQLDSWMASEYGHIQDDQWEVHELSDITYTCAEFDFNQEEPLSVDNYEPKIIMTVDQQGRSTPMACGVMVVKDIQGRPSSKLL